jgi:hypothetical protein
MMTANIQCDCEMSIADRRAAYEAAVIQALCEETAEERAERVALVQAAQRLVLLALQQTDERVDA